MPKDSTPHTPASRVHRRARERPPRRKSCIHCYASKVRCDNLQDGCSRCLSKNLDCQYPSREGGGTTAVQLPACTAVSTTTSPESCESLPSATTNCLTEFSPANQEPLEVPNLDQLFYPENESDTFKSLSGVNRALISWFEHGGVRDICPGHFQPPWEQGHFLHPRFVANGLEPLALQSRNSSKPTILEIMMTTTLKILPVRMYPGSVPPFIHETYLDHEEAKTILANCVSLCTLWRAQRDFNLDFCLASIERERDRLFSEFLGYSEVEHLAALQAMLLYAILYYLDPKIDWQTGCKDLLPVFETCHYSCMKGIVTRSEILGSRPAWEDWIIVESRRRIMLVLFLLDSLSELRRGGAVIVCPDMIELPLPASKRLWEAKDRETWEREYDIHPPTSMMYCFMDLWTKDENDFISWLADMDSLGSAVWTIVLAAKQSRR